MKTKYKLNYQVHIVGLIAVLFIIMIKVLDCYILHVPCFDIVFLSCLIFTIFLMINNWVKCYSLDTEGDLLRKIVIHYQQEENAWIDSEVLDLIQ